VEGKGPKKSLEKMVGGMWGELRGRLEKNPAPEKRQGEGGLDGFLFKRSRRGGGPGKGKDTAKRSSRSFRKSWERGRKEPGARVHAISGKKKEKTGKRVWNSGWWRVMLV